MKKLLILFVVGWLLFSYATRNTVVEESFSISSQSELYLMQLIMDAGIRFPFVVFAQAVHETDGFESKIYEECKNLFGLKIPYHRPTLAVGTCRGHAGFASYKDCVLEYKAWQDKQLSRYENLRDSVHTDQEYIKFLAAQGYAEDLKYVQKTTRWTKDVRRRITYLQANSGGINDR